MPFWIVPTHEQALWVAGISQWVFAAVCAVAALYVLVSWAREYNWWVNVSYRVPTVVGIAALSGVSGMLGYVYGALIGFALAYAVPVMAYIGLIAAGVMLVRHHLKCNCTNDWEYDESDQTSTETPAS